MSTFHEAYLSGEEKALELFDHAPSALSTEMVHPASWPEGIAEAINSYQKTLSFEKDPLPEKCQVIVTGQQAGLLGGPLYTIYKSITTIQLAETLSQPRAPVIPLFWTASDDHDFDEISHATLLTRNNDLLTLRYNPSAEEGYLKGMPAGEIPLTKQLKEIIRQAKEHCFSSEETPSVFSFLEDSLEEAASFADWFSRIQARLFAGTPLRIFDPRLSAARRITALILEQEIDAPLRSTALLLERGKELEALGFGQPIHRQPHACNFFLEVEQRRRPVFYESGQFHIPEEGLSFSQAELKSRLVHEPERFSGNVALRPIIQQALFPTLAYVAGPGEIAYWAQLQPIFRFFNRPMPVVYPRMRGRVTTLKADKLRTRLDVDPSEAFDFDALLLRALKKDDTTGMYKRFEMNRYMYVEALENLIRPYLSAGNPPSIEQMARRFHDNQLLALTRLGEALLFSDQEKRATLEAQLSRLQTLYFPEGKEQERVLSVFSFLFEYGWSLMDRMLQDFSPAYGQVQEFEL
ncbi:MAG: bacillithiol biosynthesis cysteine-adding enzyme BshC [Candidatus Hydrogenedens sp.]|nr:bacillithiol biosynthesis cysteine-adding enzyme BshC [Candidatus Hydrogenedens sp.]